uniref:Uncharacterized protein n=1 Tax=Arundo donax TaxID=35708 RepID=A0A0A9CB48_ARUDO
MLRTVLLSKTLCAYATAPHFAYRSTSADSTTTSLQSLILIKRQ